MKIPRNVPYSIKYNSELATKKPMAIASFALLLVGAPLSCNKKTTMNNKMVAKNVII
mgnify:CR=1 FL=1